MDTIKATGATAPFLTGPEIQEELRGGTTTTYSYTGTLNDCQIQRQIAKANGATSISLGPDGTGLWRLSTTFAGLPEDEGGAASEPVQNLHELEVSPEQVPVWECEIIRSHLSYADIALVRRAVGMFLSNSPLDVGGTVLTNPTKAQYVTQLLTETSNDTDSEALFNRVIAQGESATYFRSVYRRTITAASWAQVQAAFTGASKIWTSAEVVSAEGVPTSEWFGLPNVFWLKAPPRVSASYGGKTEIQYYYQEVTQPSKYFYAAYSGATLLD